MKNYLVLVNYPGSHYQRGELLKIDDDGYYIGINHPERFPDCFKEVDINDELIKAYDEYIQFLSDEISNYAAFLWTHGFKTSEDKVQKGKLLREKIKNLKR